MGFDFFSWVVIPLLIFLSRVMDVTLGTLRFIFLSRGYRKVAPLLGFVEVLIWVLAIREVMINLRNIACFLAYGAGFAVGNYVGMWVEEKLSLGMVILRVVLRKDHYKLEEFLKSKDYGYTVVDGKGSREKVKILFSIIRRKSVPEVITAISTHNPHAMFTLEDVRTVRHGVIPMGSGGNAFKKLFRKHRKSK